MKKLLLFFGLLFLFSTVFGQSFFRDAGSSGGFVSGVIQDNMVGANGGFTFDGRYDLMITGMTELGDSDNSLFGGQAVAHIIKQDSSNHFNFYGRAGIYGVTSKEIEDYNVYGVTALGLGKTVDIKTYQVDLTGEVFYTIDEGEFDLGYGLTGSLILGSVAFSVTEYFGGPLYFLIAYNF